MKNEHAQSYEAVKARLDEIVDAVNGDGISLDDALDLYEEAIKLGMQVGDLLESDISAEQIRSQIESSGTPLEEPGHDRVDRDGELDE